MNVSKQNKPASSNLFDSHCHFDFDEFGGSDSRATLWESCQQRGITNLLIPGISPGQWTNAIAIAQSLPGVFASVGLHPWWIKELRGEQLSKEQLSVMREYLSQPVCVAVGECGMDAALPLPESQQQPVFEQQIQLACEFNKPLIIHVRKTHNSTLKLLTQYRPTAGGVIHGFTGSVELAQQYWALGFYIGIGGSITYPRAAKTRKTVQLMPLESILLETDAPDMPLNGYQGQANSPLKIIEVAKTLAELRHISVDKVASITTENGFRLFNLS